MTPKAKRCAARILLLAQSNYEVQFAPDSRVSERVIFPDLAFAEQRHRGRPLRPASKTTTARRVYYATYTAYDGKMILPQLLETPDFLALQISSRLTARRCRTKAWRCFPRKINGHYAMLSRQDDENIYLMFSDNIHFWYRRRTGSEADVSVGVRAAGQLRFADRNGSGLAGAEPRRRAHAQILHWALSCWTWRPDAKSSAACASRCSSRAKTEREGYVPERGLYLRRAASTEGN